MQAAGEEIAKSTSEHRSMQDCARIVGAAVFVNTAGKKDGAKIAGAVEFANNCEHGRRRYQIKYADGRRR